MSTVPDKTTQTMQSYDGKRFVEITHRKSDPLVWIVRSSRKFLWFRMDPKTVWFQDAHQALQFAQEKA
jgi:hypothetical protein